MATFSSAVMVGIRWKDWKTMPTLPAAEARQRVLVERAEVVARDHDDAGIGPLQPGHDHQQGRLAGARRADQADRLAAPYIAGRCL